MNPIFRRSVRLEGERKPNMFVWRSGTCVFLSPCNHDNHATKVYAWRWRWKRVVLDHSNVRIMLSSEGIQKRHPKRQISTDLMTPYSAPMGHEPIRPNLHAKISIQKCKL